MSGDCQPLIPCETPGCTVSLTDGDTCGSCGRLAGPHEIDCDLDEDCTCDTCGGELREDRGLRVCHSVDCPDYLGAKG